MGQKEREWDELRRQRTHIGKSKLLSIDEKKEQAVAVKAAIAEKKKELDTAATDLRNRALYFPNALHPDVVIGEEGKVAACNHDPEDIAKAASKADHLDIRKRMRLLDFETPAEVTGSNFVTLANELALLEHALVQFAFVRLYREGFTLLNPSDLVKRNVLEACGFNPRGESTQIYSIENSDLCLVGTGEIPLAGTLINCRLDGKALEERGPVRYGAFTHCFRTEAGSMGKKNKGLYRLHQFSKVEMFVACSEDQSEDQLEALRDIQESVCEDLGLHWRTVWICRRTTRYPSFPQI